MKPYSCQVCFLVLILAVVISILDADSLDSECIPAIEVRRHTVYTVSLGQELRIKCPVSFCNNKPPDVSWYKIEGTIPFNISSKSHITTEWESFKQSEGASYLIFQNILENDAGVYRCEIKGNMGHSISVNVSDHADLSTVMTVTFPRLQQQTTLTSERPSAQYVFWHYMYRIFGILVFVLIVIAICGISKLWYKGKAKNPSQPSLQAFHHIYDNDL